MSKLLACKFDYSPLIFLNNEHKKLSHLEVGDQMIMINFVFLVLPQIAELLFLSGVVDFAVVVDALLSKRYPPPQLHVRYSLTGRWSCGGGVRIDWEGWNGSFCYSIRKYKLGVVR